MLDKPASAPTMDFEPSAPPRKRHRPSTESVISSQPSTTESASTAPTSILSPAPSLQIQTRSRAHLPGRTLFPIDCVKIESDEDEDKPAIVPRFAHHASRSLTSHSTPTPLERLFDVDGRLSIDALFANLPTIGLPACANAAERTTKLRSQIFVPPTPRALKPKLEPVD